MGETQTTARTGWEGQQLTRTQPLGVLLVLLLLLLPSGQLLHLVRKGQSIEVRGLGRIHTARENRQDVTPSFSSVQEAHIRHTTITQTHGGKDSPALQLQAFSWQRSKVQLAFLEIDFFPARATCCFLWDSFTWGGEYADVCFMVSKSCGAWAAR